jgi:prepilin-type N-terminal cleavage/methylation domain-containing protein
MNKAKGYTLIELITVIFILSVLTSISFISITSPSKLMEKEAILGEVHRTLNQAKSAALIQGRPSKLSFSPKAFWFNETKVLAFEEQGPWQWESNVNSLMFLPNRTLRVVNAQGKEDTLTQQIGLTYNQDIVAFVHIDPLKNRVKLIKNSASPNQVIGKNDSCYY